MESPGQGLIRTCQKLLNPNPNPNWIRSDKDIPEGSVGNIVELRLWKVKSEFDDSKYWSLLAQQNQLMRRAGFSSGDKVTWTRNDDDIAPGTVGEVVALKDASYQGTSWGSVIKVKFPKGTWNFKPSQLEAATGDEEESEAENVIEEGYPGEKRALLIGCTYLGLKGHLKGVARDIYRAYDWIQAPPLSIPKENIIVLSDDPACAKVSSELSTCRYMPCSEP